MRTIAAILITLILIAITVPEAGAQTVKLGNEVLLTDYLHLLAGKRVGLVTNQTGVTSTGLSLIDVLSDHPRINLSALYAPEHGLDGIAKAGEYVASYTHPDLKIPVFSLYGQTRKPTPQMLSHVDILLFDIQDIGSRTYTYMSTMNYCLHAAKENRKTFVVLDRPNPVGGMQVEGPIMEQRFVSFVGVDILPMAHGMTAGELARYFNRNISADLRVIPMKGYHRNMIFQDTGLPFIQTSPNIPDIDSCFGYMATGIGDGTGVFQADKFKWIGGAGLDSQQYAATLNAENLPGVRFMPEPRGTAGGVRLIINDYYSFNPARTGFYALAHAFSLGNFRIPKSGTTIVMFDKIMGTDQVGLWLAQKLSPSQIEANYQSRLQEFKATRERYLLPAYSPVPIVKVGGANVSFDTRPYIDDNDRLIVPVRALTEALNAEVNYFPSTKKVVIARDTTTITLTINSPALNINGQTIIMDTVPVIKDGRTMVPIRFVSEYLKAGVSWDGQHLVAYIN